MKIAPTVLLCRFPLPFRTSRFDGSRTIGRNFRSRLRAYVPAECGAAFLHFSFATSAFGFENVLLAFSCVLGLVTSGSETPCASTTI